MSKKILVAYFSASGVTAEAAKVLARAAGADIYEIVPEVAYTTEDLDWMDKTSRTTQEKDDPSIRPAITGKADNMDDYDTVFVGFPIWWYVEPAIIDTFLESYDFSGKTMIPFATSGGSGFGKGEEKMESICSPSASWKPGKMINGKVSDRDLKSWIESLGL